MCIFIWKSEVFHDGEESSFEAGGPGAALNYCDLAVVRHFRVEVVEGVNDFGGIEKFI